MGTYLSTPNRDKESTDFSNDKLTFGASSMQGWRLSQEDAHRCLPDFDEDASFFAVFDGHGGKEVAQYAANNLPSYLLNHTEYKAGNIELALEDSFLGFDATLVEEDVQHELRCLADNIHDSDPNVEDDDLEKKDNYITKIKKEAALLREEATMPIEKVLERYGGIAPFSNLKNKNISHLTNRAKFQSPIINKKIIKNSSDISSNVENNKEFDVDDDNIIKNFDANEDKNVVEENNSDKITTLHNGTLDSNDNIKIAEIQSSVSIENNTQIDESSYQADQLKKLKPNNIDGEHNLIDKKCNDNFDGNNICVQDYDVNEDDDDEVDDDDDDGNQFWMPENEDDDDDDDEDSEDDDDEDDEEEDDVNENAFKMETEVGEGGSGSALNSNDVQHNDDTNKEEIDDKVDEDDDDDEDFNSISISNSFEESPGADSGCTAVVAVLKAGRLYVANAGDSRCILSRGGLAIDMSIDHKPEDAEERARIKKAGGKVTCEGRVNGGLNLSRAIGDHTYKRNKKLSLREQMITSLPDVKTIDITPQDRFIVLACDGIWNVLSSQDVVDFVEKSLNDGISKLSTICEQLFDVCLSPDTKGDGTGCDNMTCVIITFNHSLTASTNQSHLMNFQTSINSQTDKTLPLINHISSDEYETNDKNEKFDSEHSGMAEKFESRKRKSIINEMTDQVSSSATSSKKPCFHSDVSGSNTDEDVTSSETNILTSVDYIATVSKKRSETSKIDSNSDDIGSSVD